jgi:cytochrome b561
MLMTILVVISGFVGRYIYTAIPRSPDGAELPSAPDRARQLLATWHTVHVPLGLAMFTAATLHALAGLYFNTLGR